VLPQLQWNWLAGISLIKPHHQALLSMPPWQQVAAVCQCQYHVFAVMAAICPAGKYCCLNVSSANKSGTAFFCTRLCS
jgi:hypothetical protein